MKRRLLTLLFAFVVVALLGQNVAWSQAKATAPLSSVRGKLQAATADSLDIMSAKGLVHVKIKQPLKTYGRMPSSLSKVKSTSFVGVTSVKQADGTELAKAINIFPADLRGIGEGSNMMEMPPRQRQPEPHDQRFGRPGSGCLAHDERHGAEAGCRHDSRRQVSGWSADDLRAIQCGGNGDRAHQGAT